MRLSLKLNYFVRGCKQLSCSFSDTIQPLISSLVLCPPCLWVSKCKISHTRIEVCLSCGSQYEIPVSQPFSADFILYTCTCIKFYFIFTDTMQSLVFFTVGYIHRISVYPCAKSKIYFAVFSNCINPSEIVVLFF